MENPGTGEGGRRRGRRAAPPTGPVGPLETVAAAIAAALTAGRSALVAARGRVAGWVTAFRSGPVLPWVSAHRMLVLIGGALLVSALSIGGAIAMIAQVPGPVAEGSAGDDETARPQPGSSFTMPSPAAKTPSSTPTPTPSPSPTPGPTPVDGGAESPIVEPEPPTDPVEPTTEPTTDGNGRPDPPGASNRPDKPKG
jgi:hypothetical protein